MTRCLGVRPLTTLLTKRSPEHWSVPVEGRAGSPGGRDDPRDAAVLACQGRTGPRGAAAAAERWSLDRGGPWHVAFGGRVSLLVVLRRQGVPGMRQHRYQRHGIPAAGRH